MGALLKIVDAILFFFFLIIAIGAPIIDSQTCLPSKFYPDVLVDLHQWYTREFDDYLFAEKPHFFVGLMWMEILIMWPFAIINLYGIVAGKSWLKCTCLVYGVSVFTSMVAILTEMLGSGKASDKLLMSYYPFMGFAVLAILRGLLPQSDNTTKTKLNRKKKD